MPPPLLCPPVVPPPLGKKSVWRRSCRRKFWPVVHRKIFGPPLLYLPPGFFRPKGGVQQGGHGSCFNIAEVWGSSIPSPCGTGGGGGAAWSCLIVLLILESPDIIPHGPNLRVVGCMAKMLRGKMEIRGEIMWRKIPKVYTIPLLYDPPPNVPPQPEGPRVFLLEAVLTCPPPLVAPPSCCTSPRFFGQKGGYNCGGAWYMTPPDDPYGGLRARDGGHKKGGVLRGKYI